MSWDQEILETGEGRPNNEMKVLVLGDGGAGKTSLIKRIVDKDFDPHESQTHGIDILNFEFTGSDNTTIMTHFWDFGGQEITHGTHQFFYTKRSVYILVLNARTDDRAESWLKKIESFGGSSPVLIVLNKIDENPGFEVNRKHLVEKYPAIKGFFRVSCKDGSGIIDFKEFCKTVISQQLTVKTLLPNSWFNVKQKLMNIEAGYLTHSKFVEICGEEGIQEQNQDFLMRFLHDSGTVIHYSTIDLMGTYVLKPDWITQAIYKIINSRHLADNKGILQVSTLPALLKPQTAGDYSYPPYFYRFIINLMVEFTLGYFLTKETILVPSLLDYPEPYFEFDYDNCLKFYFEYRVIPPSIMSRFIVETYKDVKDHLHWRYGVVIGDREFGTTAVVKVDNEERRLYIFVSGEEKRAHFSAIRKIIHDINSSFEKLDVDEFVPLGREPRSDKNVVVNYNTLLGYEQEGVEFYFDGILRQRFSVKKLLDGIEKPSSRDSNIMIASDLSQKKIFVTDEEKEFFSDKIVLKIDKLFLKNFRGFKSVLFPLNHQATVFIGDNGQGKTAVLEALALILEGFLSGFDAFTTGGTHEDQIRKQTKITNNTVHLKEHFPVEIKGKVIVNGQKKEWGYHLSSLKDLKDRSGIRYIESLTEKLQYYTRENERITLPVIAYYRAGRLWQQVEKVMLPEITSRFAIYEDCLESTADYKQFAQWFKKMKLTEIQEGEEGVELETVRQAVESCMKNLLDLEGDVDFLLDYEVKQDLLFIEFPDKNRIPLNLLSDGYRNVIGMVADIAYRIMALNPHLGTEAVKETSGIVLIDEIELHLHPKWQQLIINDLTTIFPGIQFIITTHSPTIIRSLSSDEIINLNQDSHSNYTGEYAGWTTDEILADEMGVERKSKYRLLIQDFNQAIMDVNPERAIEIYKSVQSMIHPTSTMGKMMRMDIITIGGSLDD